MARKINIETFFSKVLYLPNGENFHLAEWQARELRTIFNTLKNGRRQFRTSYWEIPKKNGKSTLSAGIALYGLAGDGEPNAHVYLAAASRDQTKHVFLPAAMMVERSPYLKDKFRVIWSTKTIVDRENPYRFLRAVAADAGTQDGAEPHFCIFDEVHRQKGRDLWSVMKKGQSTRREPLMFAITTAGIASETPLCWELHEHALQVHKGAVKDPRFHPVIYALDEKEDWTDERNWLRVNPAAGDIDAAGTEAFKRIDALREDFVQAVRSPGLENEFRRFELNQWVSQETRWIPLTEWNKAELFDPHELVGRPCYPGLDLSTTQDISALVLVFPIDDHFRVLPFFWLPEETAKRSPLIPYLAWSREELIYLTPGNVVDYRAIRARINELADLYVIKEIAYDPWNATQVSVELEGDGITMVPVRQGYASLSPPSKAFEKAVLAGQLQHNNNPVLKWMVDCVSLSQDPAGNIKPVKPDRQKTKKRIDGVVAAIMGLDRCMRHKKTVSSYADPETAVM